MYVCVAGRNNTCAILHRRSSVLVSQRILHRHVHPLAHARLHRHETRSRKTSRQLPMTTITNEQDYRPVEKAVEVCKKYYPEPWSMFKLEDNSEKIKDDVAACITALKNALGRFELDFWFPEAKNMQPPFTAEGYDVVRSKEFILKENREHSRDDGPMTRLSRLVKDVPTYSNSEREIVTFAVYGYFVLELEKLYRAHGIPLWSNRVLSIAHLSEAFWTNYNEGGGSISVPNGWPRDLKKHFNEA